LPGCAGGDDDGDGEGGDGDTETVASGGSETVQMEGFKVPAESVLRRANWTTHRRSPNSV